MPEKQSDTNLALEHALASSPRQTAIRQIREGETEGTTQLQRDVATCRAGRALGWSREKIITETGWGLSRYLKAEKRMEEDEIRYWQQQRPEVTYSSFKAQLDMLVEELGDAMSKLSVAQNNPQVFVSAVKVRGDLLIKLLEKGQEMGLIKRTPKRVEFDARIDVTKSVKEIRVQIQQELTKVNELLVDPLEEEKTGVSAAILRRLDPERRMIEAKAEEIPAEDRERIAEKLSTE